MRGTFRLWLAVVSFAIALAIPFQNCSDFSLSEQEERQLASLAVDSRAPELFLIKTPSAITAANDSVFEFSSDEPDVLFECSLSGTFEVCTSPKVLSGLSDGPHTIVIRAVDAAGNKSEEKTYQWTVDHTAPTVTISTSIAAFRNVNSESIAFAGADGGPAITSFECKIDFLDYSPCTSPYVVNNLNEGDHTVQIRGRDAVNNLSQPAVISWRIDRSPPVVNITSGPSGTTTITTTSIGVVFGFSAQDTGGSLIRTITCKLDSGAEVNCTSTASYTVAANSVNHTFTVKVTDNAGNSTSVSRVFRYDFDPGTSAGDVGAGAGPL